MQVLWMVKQHQSDGDSGPFPARRHGPSRPGPNHRNHLMMNGSHSCVCDGETNEFFVVKIDVF